MLTIHLRILKKAVYASNSADIKCHATKRNSPVNVFQKFNKSLI